MTVITFIPQDVLDNLSLKEIANKNNLKLSIINNLSENFNKFDEKNKIG